MAAIEVQNSFYLRGKRAGLFWGYVGILIFSTAIQLLNDAVLKSLPVGDGLMLALFYSVLFIAITVPFLIGIHLILAFRSDFKPFRIVFFVIAGGEILFAFVILLRNFIISPAFIAMGAVALYNQIIVVMSAAYTLLRLLSIVCMIVIAFNRRSNLLLKVSSWVCVIGNLYVLARYFSSMFFWRQLAAEMGLASYTQLMMFLYYFDVALEIAFSVFFAAALCFTKAVPPKAPVVVSPAPIPPEQAG